MRLIRYSVNSNRGFTLPELMVAMFLGLLVGAIMLSSTMANKRAYNYDLKRIVLDQNLRNSMDILGSALRVGGENFPSSFPAFEIVNGSGGPDELIIRRNLLDEVLSVCSPIAAGSASLQVYFAVGGATSSACTYSGQTHSFNTWRAHRNSVGGSVKAFIYNVSAKQGEFFNYTNEGSTGTAYYVLRSGGTWSNAYPINSSSVYILEEWKIKLVGNLLTLEINGDTSSPRHVATDISNLQVSAIMADGTTMTSLSRTDDWSDIAAIEISLTASNTYLKKPITRVLTSRYFPRNILSK